MPKREKEVSRDEESWIDVDIASMKLSYGEKAGLQVYRNYSNSFEEYNINKFKKIIDSEKISLEELQSILQKICIEDERFLPIIVCAFADNVLKETFNRALPDQIPGGKSSMLNGYGALSDLSKRIQLAYAFDIFSADVMKDLDVLRSVRNKISHGWNIENLNEFLATGRLTEMHPTERYLTGHQGLADAISSGLRPLAAFRIRLAWLVARLVYEGAAYYRAKEARLVPARALYGKPASKWMSVIAVLAKHATDSILSE